MSEIPEPSESARRRRAGKSAGWRGDANQGPSRGIMIAVTLFLLMAVAGVLIGIFFRLSSANEPIIISVPISQYKHSAWPVNPWAERDSDILCSYFRRRGDESLATKAFNNQELLAFRNLLNTVAGRSTGGVENVKADYQKRPLVLHISGLAATRSGKVYLLPGDAVPAESEAPPPSWVPVEEVLDAMSEAPNKQKLLLLDLGRPIASPFNGVVWNDSTTVLHEMLKQRAAEGKLPFSVLTSCGAGEWSYSADAVQCSVFAFYLAEGLRGLADGYNDADAKDQHVSVSELARFTTNRVNRYSRLVHDRRQTPQFFPAPGDNGNFELTVQALEEFPLTPSAIPFHPSLQAAWQVRDAAQAAHADRGSPVAFTRLTRGLMRMDAEWLWSADAARADRAEVERARTLTSWEADQRNLGSAAPASDIQTGALAVVGRYRLAAARVGRAAPPNDWGIAFDKYITARLAEPAKPDELMAAKTAWAEKANTNPLDAAWVIWDRVRRFAAPERNRVVAWGEAMGELTLPRLYIEVLLLKMVADRNFRLRQGLLNFPAETIGKMFQAEYEVGRTVAMNPEGFPLVETTMNEAETSRVRGMTLLFNAGKTTAVRKELEEADAAFASAVTGFTEARNTLARWQEAKRTWEAGILAIHQTRAGAVNRSTPSFDEWLHAARTAASLGTKIATSSQRRRFDPAAVSGDRTALDTSAAKLREPFAEPRVKAILEKPDRKSAAEVVPLLELVEGPTLPAAARKQTWDAIHTDWKKLHEAARAQDQADEDAKAKTSAPNDNASSPSESDWSLRRVRASFALLGMTGYDKLAEVELLMRSFELNPSDAATRQKLGDRLAQAWTSDIPEQAKAALKPETAMNAERAARSYPWGALSAGALPVDVTSQQAREEVRAYRDWVRQQLLHDQPHLLSTPGADGFYPAVGDLK